MKFSFLKNNNKCRINRRYGEKVCADGSILRSKRFRLVSEQRKTKERDFHVVFGFGRAKKGTRAKKWSGGRGRGRKEGFLPFFPTPSLLFYSPPLTLLPRSLLRNRTETLATQASMVQAIQLRKKSLVFCSDLFWTVWPAYRLPDCSGNWRHWTLWDECNGRKGEGAAWPSG